VFKYFGIYVTMKKRKTTLVLLKDAQRKYACTGRQFHLKRKNTNGDYVAFFMYDSARALNQGARYDNTHDLSSI